MIKLQIKSDSAKVAKISMNNAAADFKKSHKVLLTLGLLLRGNVGIVDIGVTVAWQRRGYTPMNGVGVAMSIDCGKILDIEPLSIL